ncbi:MULTISPECIES: formate/nitrite transporter family protein [Bacillus]|uniref:Transporter n=1 Tax=Bacillus glycinifermentans TaxID=1664069 RepID=A0AAJ4D4H4_9BACI|nr:MULTISPECIES: formate/nitrite transporter family protein [Bacillus]KKB75186.1 transporter [Bacillus sp. TH008]MBU8786075.1 formate/nitrite transporter family protein [Bacillus glycinifermentans]MDU0071631.1 formate/nitrite transporter family protein [Bacillus sp. IG6]MED8020023.1 formate/nitrite transporter family protein [Bacillus glycinifermentans]NUJ17594.1 formate/nitrite transporter family protein [Bacillus glycinifermentans]
METKSLMLVEELALKKCSIFKESPLRYFLRSMLASMFIGFGVIVAFKTGNFFYLEQSPFTYPIAAVTFGGAIILIVYGGGDLFTGNTFYYTFAALRKKMRWFDAIGMWLFSYAGNFMGAILFAGLIFSTGLFKDSSVNSFLLSAAEHKMNSPMTELFFRAILCNWLVCLAFFIPMSQKGDGAKMFSMMLFVFCFFISGYEHSIANMATFAVALVTDHPDTISLYGAVRNLIPVTLGNIVGGAFMMGFMYHFANRPQTEDMIK